MSQLSPDHPLRPSRNPGKAIADYSPGFSERNWTLILGFLSSTLGAHIGYVGFARKIYSITEDISLITDLLG